MYNIIFLLICLVCSELEHLGAYQQQVLCVGAPSVDIIKRLHHPVELEGIGGSFAISASEFDRLLTDDNGTIEATVAGGSGANLIRALGHLGTSAALKGRIGNDAHAKIFLDSLAKANVTPLLDVSYTMPTQRVLHLIQPNGERNFRRCLGATEELHSSQLNVKDFAQKQLVHVEGSLLRSGNVVEKSFLLAKQQGAKTSFDIGSHQLATEYRARILNLLQGWIDICFANAEEALALTGLDPYHACEYLQNFCPCVVILWGEEGCFVGSQGRVTHVPTAKVEIVDALGAGDYFGAGFIFSTLRGYTLENCARIGNMLGGAVVQFPGASLPDAQWEIIQTYINSMDAYLR